MKRIVSLVLVLVLCFSLSAVALAEANDTSEEDNAVSERVGSDDPQRAEETKWYFRVTDEGWIQQRLWSITYGYWKTDWITVGHVNPNP